MQITSLAVAVLVGVAGLHAQAPPRRSGGTATLAVRVTDPSGTPIGGVRVTVEGPTPKQSTTEQGRIAFENLALGSYKLRFEREGFITLERELIARAGAPIDVKVTLTPAPKPVEPVAPPPPPPPAPSSRPVDVNAAPMVIDMSSFIESNFVGRSGQKNSQLVCGSGGSATLIQLREPLAEHVHSEADEFLYVIAGEGAARLNGREEKLRVGFFMLVPRGIAHTLTPSGRTPLVALSVRAGDRCPPSR
jgi:hypothetical protein